MLVRALIQTFLLFDTYMYIVWHWKCTSSRYNY